MNYLEELTSLYSAFNSYIIDNIISIFISIFIFSITIHTENIKKKYKKKLGNIYEKYDTILLEFNKSQNENIVLEATIRELKSKYMELKKNRNTLTKLYRSLYNKTNSSSKIQNKYLTDSNNNELSFDIYEQKDLTNHKVNGYIGDKYVNSWRSCIRTMLKKAFLEGNTITTLKKELNVINLMNQQYNKYGYEKVEDCPFAITNYNSNKSYRIIMEISKKFHIPTDDLKIVELK